MDFVYLALPLLVVVPLYFWLSIQEHESYLESICLDLPRGHFRRSIPLTTQINSGDGAYLFESMHHDRKFSVEYRYHWKQNALRRFTSQPALREQLEVNFPLVQKFWLRMISRQQTINMEAGILIGNEFDENFLIHSNQPNAAREFLNHPYILQNFSRITFDHLEIHRGWLRVMIEAPAKREFSMYQLDSTADALCNVAYFYEAQLRTVHVLTQMEDASLCPYCRGELSATDAVVECTNCGTLLHESCWKENGQCTTWGCNSELTRNA